MHVNFYTSSQKVFETCSRVVTARGIRFRPKHIINKQPPSMFPAGQVIVGRLPSSYPAYEHTHADIAISVTFDIHLELLSSPRLEHGSRLLGQILTAKEREEGGAAGD